MYIVHIASELAPIAKVGGLGDVIHGLSKELVKQGHEVEIVLPKYDCIDHSKLENLKVHYRALWSFEAPHRYNNTVWSAQTDGLNVLLIEPHHPSYYFSRGRIYGSPDDVDRFLYFCRATLEYFLKAEKKPDVIHIHDWPTASVAVLYKELYIPLGLKLGKIVLTIHNLAHQGKCHPKQLTKVGLRGENYLTPDKMMDPLSPTMINLFKGGLAYSDALTTVSPTYEREIKTPEVGYGLDPVLVKHEKKLKGILNGIEYNFWNPQKDTLLPVHYPSDPTKLEEVLKGKSENRKRLRQHFGMEETDKPLVSAVSRLVHQKAPHLIKHALLHTLAKGGQFILLGSEAHLELHKELLILKKTLSENKNVAILLDFNEALAHQLFAAADMFIIPSIFEPCGLTQMIALHYGTVPIARRTGGLADTVFDIDTSIVPETERNGFTFDFPDAAGVDWALNRALECWSDKKKWHTLMRNGMHKDLSWTKPAKEYLSIYST